MSGQIPTTQSITQQRAQQQMMQQQMKQQKIMQQQMMQQQMMQQQMMQQQTMQQQLIPYSQNRGALNQGQGQGSYNNSQVNSINQPQNPSLGMSQQYKKNKQNQFGGQASWQSAVFGVGSGSASGTPLAKTDTLKGSGKVYGVTRKRKGAVMPWKWKHGLAVCEKKSPDQLYWLDPPHMKKKK